MDLDKVDLMTEAASLRSGWQACQARLAAVEAARAAAVAWVDGQEDATDLKGLGNYD